MSENQKEKLMGNNGEKRKIKWRAKIQGKNNMGRKKESKKQGMKKK